MHSLFIGEADTWVVVVEAEIKRLKLFEGGHSISYNYI